MHLEFHDDTTTTTCVYIKERTTPNDRDGINLLFVEASLQENDICKEMTSIKPKTRHLQDCKVFARNLQVARILQEFCTRLNPR
jgi:hypothetical protein